MVTALYFFETPTKSLPLAIWSMAVDRGRLRRFNGVTFAKLLGAGKGETFTPRDADINRWGFLVVIEDDRLAALDQSRIVKKWRRFSSGEYRILLDPISSHGKWSKREPFKVK
ncbi:MAG: spheroidene monooxygenase, partial [Actinobacteria bacterium]|nr:spheroidene monooxygenase [Actinomycetota bacterium]